MLVLLVCAVGTLGYAVIEGWGLWDAVLHDHHHGHDGRVRRCAPAVSRAGEAWTAFVLFGGVATLFYTGFVVMQLVVDGELHRGFEQRRFRRMLDALANHFIICGYGRIGSIIAEEFRRQHVPYVVIDRDPDRVHASHRRRRTRRGGRRQP